MKYEAKSPLAADIGDYLKVFACTAVMLQIILVEALQTHPSPSAQIGIGIFYDLTKFTAPAFIAGILYTTTRIAVDSNLTYRTYLIQMWHALFIPTIAWTTIYLLVMPWVQQVHRYHDLQTFAWQFINGNAAPHLWYNSMMLQFIILMPVFWWLARWCGQNRFRSILVLITVSLIQIAWLGFYDRQVFHGPHMQDWYLLDRLFISFLMYGVLGVLAWQYRHITTRFLHKWHWVSLIIAGASFVWINWELLSYSLPIQVINAPYYKPSMTIYDLSIICLIAAFAANQLNNRPQIAQTIHFMANYAYPAFLSNVFWNQLLWLTFSRALTTNEPLIGIILVYLGTWVLSFASAIMIHWVWKQIRTVTFVRSKNDQ